MCFNTANSCFNTANSFHYLCKLRPSSLILANAILYYQMCPWSMWVKNQKWHYYYHHHHNYYFDSTSKKRFGERNIFYINWYNYINQSSSVEIVSSHEWKVIETRAWLLRRPRRFDLPKTAELIDLRKRKKKCCCSFLYFLFLFKSPASWS